MTWKKLNEKTFLQLVMCGARDENICLPKGKVCDLFHNNNHV